MNRKLLSCLAASAALSAGSAFATVAVSTVDVTSSTAWAGTFGGGSLAISPLASFTGHVSSTLAASSGMNQSFKGDGNVLEGFGLYITGASNASALTYTIALIDYGVSATRIDTAGEFNSVATTLFQDTLTIGSLPSRQMYFDFSAGSNVTLLSSHSYGMALLSPSGSTTFFDRSSTDAFVDGVGFFGTVGAFNSSISGGGLRTSNFAVYTSAVPEPSTYAAIVGAVAGAAVFLRRKRR